MSSLGYRGRSVLPWVWIVGALAAFIPLVYYVFTQFLDPAPFYVRYDPEVTYMLSSLSIFKGHRFVYYHHPGTPLEIVGAGLLALTKPLVGGGSQEFVRMHLQEPRIFLTMARFVLTASAVIGILVLVTQSWRASNRWFLLPSVATGLSYYAVHPGSFDSGIYWSHNSIAFPFGTLMLIYLIASLQTNEKRFSKAAAVYGIGAGLLAATQIYFGAWSVGGMVAYGIAAYSSTGRLTRGMLVGALSGASSIASFFLATLPIAHKYPDLLRWLGNLISHQGRYGGGPSGFTSISQISQNMSNFRGELPVLFVVCVMFSLAIVISLVFQRSRSKLKGSALALSLGLLVQLAVLIAAVLKHFASIYLLSAAAMVPAFMFLGILLLEEEMLLRKRWILLGINLIAAIVLFAAATNLWRAANRHQERAHRLRSAEEQMQDLLSDSTSGSVALRNQGDGAILWTYNSYSRCYALWHGNGYADLAFGEDLADLCPGHFELNIWNGRVRGTDGSWKDPEKIDWSMIFTAEQVLENYSYLLDFGTSYPTGIESSAGEVYVIVPDE